MKNKIIKTHYKILIALVLLLPILFFISMNAGYTRIGFSEILHILAGRGSIKDNIVVFQFRLPRIIIAMLVGAGFSLSGCILQGLTKNPLADPGLMGINAGAGIVVLIFMTLSGTMIMGKMISLPIFSLIGALITGSMIYILSNRKSYGISPIRLVLNGVAIQAGINAAMTLLILKLDDTQAEFLTAWQSGSIWNSTWKSMIALFPWILVGFLILIFMARKMDVLVMGDELSKGLGVAVIKEKRKLLFLAVALAAACVAISGNINFVGLIAPHLSRRLVGARHKILLPVCALVGAILVLVADIIARTVMEPAEIPTGIVVSVIGAPYFIFLLVKNRKAAGNK
ncbi:iron complex transport system permease protein [Mobilisporobacter senegalensis]|uniref:Iron complex transport system permease protein n=1 Tax=Mobilisporobacter senegalensis TaxID=1329262 RepID=A0A3N1XV38_9FIRM|nr:iron ABC transporter permease [Mobilisporobacter senegalensis]ROR30466.1 iron complex transport system permease protein [Mobilisporobacter senegalensis]